MFPYSFCVTFLYVVLDRVVPYSPSVDATPAGQRRDVQLPCMTIPSWGLRVEPTGLRRSRLSCLHYTHSRAPRVQILSCAAHSRLRPDAVLLDATLMLEPSIQLAMQVMPKMVACTDRARFKPHRHDSADWETNLKLYYRMYTSHRNRFDHLPKSRYTWGSSRQATGSKVSNTKRTSVIRFSCPRFQASVLERGDSDMIKHSSRHSTSGCIYFKSKVYGLTSAA